MVTWLAIALLGAGVVTFLWPRRYHPQHPKAWRGQRYCYPSYAWLAASPALFILLNHWFHVYAWASVTFWVIWLIALLVVMLNKRDNGFWPAFIMSIAAWTLVLLPFGSNVFHGDTTPRAQALTVATADGKTQTLDYVESAKTDKPVSGKDVNTATTPPSLDDGKGAVHSWTELVQRVNGLPKAKKDAYIAAINARSQYLGTWDDVQKYAAMEKKDKNLDTRVILVINSTDTDQQARDAVRSDVGAATDKLPIVRVSGALVNTRGVDAGKIEDFADGRSQIRVILTTPKVEKDAKGTTKAAANTDAAKKGTGVLTECTNPSTGIVHHPTPHPVPTKKTPKPSPSTPTSTPSTSTTPGTPTPTPSTPTPTPSTPTPTPSTPTPTPSTPTPTPSTPTPTPSTPTPTPSKSCEAGQVWDEGSEECLQTKDPGDNVPGPSGKPTAPAPSGSAETAAPVESHPADPTHKPGDEATDLPADGATQQPADPTPAPTSSDAPTEDQSGTGSGDPDGNSLAGLFAAPLLGLAFRRKTLG